MFACTFMLRIAIFLKLNPVRLFKRLARLRDPILNPWTRRFFAPCLITIEDIRTVL